VTATVTATHAAMTELTVRIENMGHEIFISGLVLQFTY
jgi:hypothetical protein